MIPRSHGRQRPACDRLLPRDAPSNRRLDRGGLLGGEPPNAADLQIAPSPRLAMSLDDLRPAIEGRPAGRLATQIVKEFPGRTPAVLPPEWLEPVAAPAGRATGGSRPRFRVGPEEHRGPGCPCWPGCVQPRAVSLAARGGFGCAGERAVLGRRAGEQRVYGWERCRLKI